MFFFWLYFIFHLSNDDIFYYMQNILSRQIMAEEESEEKEYRWETGYEKTWYNMNFMLIILYICTHLISMALFNNWIKALRLVSKHSDL